MLTTSSKIDGAPAARSSGAAVANPLTLAAMSLGYAVVQLDLTIVNTALASIAASLARHGVAFRTSHSAALRSRVSGLWANSSRAGSNRP